MTSTDAAEPQSIYQAAGGQPFFDALVGAFYRRVDGNAVLRPLYPVDTSAAEQALAAFLAQYFGGPPDYSAAKGHPRLRMRHAHLSIGRAERDAWYDEMASALGSVAGTLAEPIRGAILEYFARSADWMMNTDP